jgi:hypothetical protein
MFLYVNFLTGYPKTLFLDFNTSILELKYLIYDQIGIPICYWDLYFKGKLLEDDKSLRFYGIEHHGNILAISNEESWRE